jgi:hypothetical protein
VGQRQNPADPDADLADVMRTKRSPELLREVPWVAITCSTCAFLGEDLQAMDSSPRRMR